MLLIYSAGSSFSLLPEESVTANQLTDTISLTRAIRWRHRSSSKRLFLSTEIAVSYELDLAKLYITGNKIRPYLCLLRAFGDWFWCDKILTDELNGTNRWVEVVKRVRTYAHVLFFLSLLPPCSSTHTNAQTIPQVEWEHTHINHAMHYNSIEKTKDTNTVCLFPIHSLSK